MTDELKVEVETADQGALDEAAAPVAAENQDLAAQGVEVPLQLGTACAACMDGEGGEGCEGQG